MKKKNNYLKEAGVLLITIGLIASCMTVTASTFEEKQDILFEQNPPGPENPMKRMTSDSFEFLFGNTYACYDDFWDVTYPICGISWWGMSMLFENGVWEEVCEPTEVPFNIVFYEDDNGEPGTVVYSYEDVMPVITNTGVTYYSEIADMYFNLYYYEVSKLANSCDLSDGWVSIKATDGDNCLFLWQQSPEGNNIFLQRDREMPYIVHELDLSFVLKIAIPEMLIFDGETSGKTGEEQTFSISASGPEGYDVFYYIEWGDNQITDWDGPHPSDEIVNVKHTWEEQGDYTIKAKAKNTIEIETDWMYLEVSMPKSKSVNRPFITFLENHPHLFPIIRQILKLNNI
jgi:hypothetical protein